ncbi:MAG TPA: hypothetical protein IGS40_12570 [Trichormus sp. M33_DOE_039]|nr:hypothetical protein [Trichormus sp. M33_DOE_039]
MVEKKVTCIDVLKPNGELGTAEITFADAEWADQSVTIVCLWDVSDRSIN